MYSKTKIIAIGATAVLAAGLLTGASAVHERSVAGDWTDRQIIDGLVMARGPVADRLGLAQENLDALTPSQKAEADKVESAISVEILKNHKQEVVEARMLLTSGDPYRVEEGRRLLASAFQDAVTQTHPEIASRVAAEPRCGLIAACGLVAVLGVALGVAVVVVAEAAVVGHAAVYAKQALWGKGLSTDPGAGGATVPGLSDAVTTAKIADALKTSRP